MSLAQITEATDAAGRILDGAGQQGAVVYLAVLVVLGCGSILLIFLWGFWKVWAQPEQSRRLKQEERANAEFENNIETQKVLRSSTERISNAMQEQSSLMGVVAKASEVVKRQSSELIDLHQSKDSVFSVHYLERMYLSKAKLFLDLMEQVEKAEGIPYRPDPHLKALFMEEVRKLDQRINSR